MRHRAVAPGGQRTAGGRAISPITLICGSAHRPISNVEEETMNMHSCRASRAVPFCRSLIVAGLVALSLFTGCDRGKSSAGASGSTTAQSSSAELKKVKIGYVGLTCDTDLFVAYEKGFFKDEGLDVEMVKMPWPDLRDALSFGRIDATHHLVMFLLKPIEGGVNIRLTAGVHKGCLRVQAGMETDVKAVTDLKGKRIAVPGL